MDYRYADDPEIICQVQNIEHNKQKIVFIMNNDQIGFCEIMYLQSNICYLTYLEINKELHSKGIGTRCMNNIFCFLSKKKYT
jgi:hypothetical protein